MQRNLQIMRLKQSGVVAVEFALIAAVFFTILIGILEFGRVLFYMNSAAEATRLGARIAVVCDMNAPGIRANMRNQLNILTDQNINVGYKPNGCAPETCKSIIVEITNVSIGTFIPYAPVSVKTITLPPFSTSLPRESMSSTDNSLCA